LGTTCGDQVVPFVVFKIAGALPTAVQTVADMHERPTVSKLESPMVQVVPPS
jgi:hypothetical protein